MILAQGSPYRMFMNNVIKKMYENGELDKILKKWKISKPDCSPLLRTGKSVKLEKIVPLFVLISLGVCLAVIVMILEVVFEYYKPTNFEPTDHDNLLRFKFIIDETHKTLHSNSRPNNHLLNMVENSARKLKTD